MQFATYAILGFSITLNFVAIWLLSNAKAARERYLTDYKESQRIVLRIENRIYADLSLAQLEHLNNFRVGTVGTRTLIIE